MLKRVGNVRPLFQSSRANKQDNTPKNIASLLEEAANRMSGNKQRRRDVIVRRITRKSSRKPGDIIPFLKDTISPMSERIVKSDNAEQMLLPAMLIVPKASKGKISIGDIARWRSAAGIQLGLLVFDFTHSLRGIDRDATIIISPLSDKDWPMIRCLQVFISLLCQSGVKIATIVGGNLEAKQDWGINAIRAPMSGPADRIGDVLRIQVDGLKGYISDSIIDMISGA